MNYRSLGSSNISVSETSLGCMSLKTTNREANEVIARVLDYGINFFDTADLYEFGLNEELVGKAIQGKRDNVIIATKGGNEWGAARDGWHWNPSKNYLLKAVEDSLRRLKTDYIDLYQLHGGTIDDPIDETIEAFELLKEQGKIREYGISSIRPNVIREYVKRSNIVSVMMQYNLLDRRPEETVFNLLRENNISVIVRGALAKGLLVDKPVEAYLGLPKSAVATTQEGCKSVAHTQQVVSSQVATKFALHPEVVSTAAIGFRTIKQVDDLLANYDQWSLSKTSQATLLDLPGVQGYADHR